MLTFPKISAAHLRAMPIDWPHVFELDSTVNAGANAQSLASRCDFKITTKKQAIFDPGSCTCRPVIVVTKLKNKDVPTV